MLHCEVWKVTTWQSKNEEDLKNEYDNKNWDSLKYEDDLKMKKNLKNEDDFKIEDDLKKKMLNSRQSPALAYMNRVVIVFTSFVAYSCRYWGVYIA